MIPLLQSTKGIISDFIGIGIPLVARN
jgi:hypothetical protein